MSEQGVRSGRRRLRPVSLVALVAVLATAALAVSVAPRGVGAADFSTGDSVVVDTDFLNLREDFGTDAEVVTVLENGATATVAGGPEEADGYSWYELDVEDGSVGWAASDFLALAAAEDPGFSEGDAVVVVGSSLNLRAEAGLTADVVDVMADGSAATVLSGPVTADGLPWYELDTEDYGQGWSAAGFLAPADDAPSADTFPDGATLVVQTGDGSTLNLREEPSIDADVVDELPDGSSVVVLYGPESADGYDWYELNTDLGVGWSADEFLAYPAESIAVGDTVTVVDGTLNLRDDAGLDADVLDTLPDGTVLEVSDGPVSADGWTWFEVSNEDVGPGWVAGEFLVVETAGGQTLVAEAAAEEETPTTTETATVTTTATAIAPASSSPAAT
ncbi:MAG: hypothetical protein QOF73_4356 [Thermomicrobiales bacterium]|jgi:uncharacterized protein YgiM (DUF1202 family)|nr:hypothetical protein [Thermomicrobiales bacterium]